MSEVKLPQLPDNSKFKGPTEPAGAEKTNSPIKGIPDMPKQPVLKQVAAGTVAPVSTGKKMLRSFFQNDLKSIGASILKDTVVPSIKNAACNIIVDAAYSIFGCKRPTRSGWTNYNASSRVYRPGDRNYSRASEPQSSPVVNSMPDIGDIHFRTYDEARAVLDILDETMQDYHWVSVAQVFQTIGMTYPPTYHNYGWTDLSEARIRNDGGEYVIIMPHTIRA